MIEDHRKKNLKNGHFYLLFLQKFPKGQFYFVYLVLLDKNLKLVVYCDWSEGSVFISEGNHFISKIIFTFVSSSFVFQYEH